MPAFKSSNNNNPISNSFPIDNNIVQQQPPQQQPLFPPSKPITAKDNKHRGGLTNADIKGILRAFFSYLFQ
jgi:hypothetical protein